MEDHKEKIADLEKKFLLFEQKLLSGIDNIQDNQKEAVAAIVDIKEATKYNIKINENISLKPNQVKF